MNLDASYSARCIHVLVCCEFSLCNADSREIASLSGINPPASRWRNAHFIAAVNTKFKIMAWRLRIVYAERQVRSVINLFTPSIQHSRLPTYGGAPSSTPGTPPEPIASHVKIQRISIHRPVSSSKSIVSVVPCTTPFPSVLDAFIALVFTEPETELLGEDPFHR